MRRLLRRALLLAAVAGLLAACSAATRVAYNNAPLAIAWAVDDWVDLHDGQRDWVKDRAVKLLAWHRESELPDYERLLQDTAARTAVRIREEDARRVYREMRALYHRTLRRAIPDIADFLLQVHPEQVATLERRFAEDNAKVAKENLRGPAQERAAQRAKRFAERIDDWTGRLSAAQRELVRARVTAMEDVSEGWMADRLQRQGEVLALVRARPSREAMVAGLTRVLIDTDTWRAPGYAARMRVRDEQVIALVVALDATLTPEQRAHLNRRVRGYAADVAYLMVAN